jgi:hypothetical protein
MGIMNLSFRPEGVGFIYTLSAEIEALEADAVTHQCRNAAASTVLCDHPHGFTDWEGFNDMIYVASLALAQDFQRADFFHKLAVGVGEAWI